MGGNLCGNKLHSLVHTVLKYERVHKIVHEDGLRYAEFIFSGACHFLYLAGGSFLHRGIIAGNKLPACDLVDKILGIVGVVEACLPEGGGTLLESVTGVC